MFTILLHSSKTMRIVAPTEHLPASIHEPVLSKMTLELNRYLSSLSIQQLQSAMNISEEMAMNVQGLIQASVTPHSTRPAIDLFLGDIYSGLQAHSFSLEDREYANTHLFILSGLYGILRALDEIGPYRLEMGYKLPGNAHDSTQPHITSLYAFWGDAIARQLPRNQTIINLSAKEYTKAIFPHFKHIEGLKDVSIISPKFLTIGPKTGEPTFVTVHAKIARGAYARWLIQNRIEDIEKLKEFNEIGYVYNEALSSAEEPVFVAKEFKGLGLSIRLTGEH